MSRLRWLIPCAVVLSACPPAIDTGGDGGDEPIVVGPEGGIFVRNSFVMDVPRGAVSSEVTITFGTVDTGIPDVPGRKRISYGYVFSPQSTTFNSLIRIYLPWLDDRVPQAVDPDSFDMRRMSGTDPYLQLQGAKTNLSPVKNVEAQTERLGKFWITSPTEPNVARLELDPTEVTLRVGDTKQFTARVVDPTGGTIEATITWSVAPPRVGTVDARGLFTATDPGTATVTASFGKQLTTATVRVQGTATGPSSWVHQNPFPTGNDLWGGALAPAGLGTLFSGANGTVLAQAANGTWARLFSTPGVILKAVGGTTASDAVAVGTTGTSGVLVTFHGTTQAPTLQVFPAQQITDLVALSFDGAHGMAVGSGNDVLLYKNGAWGREYDPSFEKLLSVAGDGTGAFVVVGNLGSLYRYDPARAVWDSLYQTRLAVQLTAATLADATVPEAWAVGGNKLWHFASGGWAAVSLPATPALTEATTLGLFDGRVLVGGREGKLGQVLVFDPSAVSTDGGAPASWASFALHRPQIPRGIFGGGKASATGFVVGDFGAVWAWDHATATLLERSYGFTGDVADVAVLDDDVFVTENECLNDSCSVRAGQVMHQGPTGRFVPLGALPPVGAVYAVAAKSKTEVVVSADTGVWRWDGSAWLTVGVANGYAAPILDLKYCGASLIGVGKKGNWYKGTSTSLSNAGALLSGGNLTALACRDADELWAAGDKVLMAKVGAGTWAPRTSSSVTAAPWKAVWSPGPGEAFAFGSANYGEYWDTQAMLAIEQPGGVVPDEIAGLWGSSIDNLYAVGVISFPARTGVALRFDGTQWQVVDPGSQRKVTAIDGSSATNIWFGTEGGGVMKAVAK